MSAERQQQIEALAQAAADGYVMKGAEVIDLGCAYRALAARLSGLQEAVRHVIADSPGTPDSVKKYLAAALNGEPS